MIKISTLFYLLLIRERNRTAFPTYFIQYNAIPEKIKLIFIKTNLFVLTYTAKNTKKD